MYEIIYFINHNYATFQLTFFTRYNENTCFNRFPDVKRNSVEQIHFFMTFTVVFP